MGAPENDAHVRIARVECIHRSGLLVGYTTHHEHDHVERATNKSLNSHRSTRCIRAEVKGAQRTVKYETFGLQRKVQYSTL